MLSKNSRVLTILTLIVAVAVSAYAVDQRTKLKPGLNLFSPQQDVEMGRESAKQADSRPISTSCCGEQRFNPGFNFVRWSTA